MYFGHIFWLSLIVRKFTVFGKYLNKPCFFPSLQLAEVEYHLTSQVFLYSDAVGKSFSV